MQCCRLDESELSFCALRNGEAHQAGCLHLKYPPVDGEGPANNKKSCAVTQIDLDRCVLLTAAKSEQPNTFIHQKESRTVRRKQIIPISLLSEQRIPEKK